MKSAKQWYGKLRCTSPGRIFSNTKRLKEFSVIDMGNRDAHAFHASRVVVISSGSFADAAQALAGKLSLIASAGEPALRLHFGSLDDQPTISLPFIEPAAWTPASGRLLPAAAPSSDPTLGNIEASPTPPPMLSPLKPVMCKGRLPNRLPAGVDISGHLASPQPNNNGANDPFHSKRLMPPIVHSPSNSGQLANTDGSGPSTSKSAC
jgi:hypothetical protein